MVSFLIAVYYNVIIAICIYFLFKSMAGQVPWATCGNPWNTDACMTLDDIVNARKGRLLAILNQYKPGEDNSMTGIHG